MKFVKIDPPGTWCQHDAVLQLVKELRARSFVEVGCGAGDLSFQLCEKGLKGIGVDFSAEAIMRAYQRMHSYIEAGQYELIQGDAFAIENKETRDRKVDLGISMMVMEHVEDDVGFLKKIASLVKPGGHVLVGVPGRRDRWNIEDETVGHLRRYDRRDLVETMESAGFSGVRVISVAVPVANLLFYVGNILVKKSKEVEKTRLSLRAQTESSGIREIPFKTVFPSFFRIILNRVTMYPLILLQRLFYGTGLGLTMLGFGKVKSSSDH